MSLGEILLVMAVAIKFAAIMNEWKGPDCDRWAFAAAILGFLSLWLEGR